MNNFFIDTFELTYKTTFDDMIEKLESFQKFKNQKNEYVCNTHMKDRVYMISKKCSKGERHKAGKKYKIVIRISPDNIPIKREDHSHITDETEFAKMICNVDKLINHWFEDLHIDDFKLTRFDITKDIQGIPEPMIQEYIMMMRRHFTPNIFELNTPLEEYTDDFRKYDSFNALKKDKEQKQKQKEVEFVVYNKHRAGIDQQLSSSELEYYSDTMRLEIRCLKKYFKERTKGFETSQTLMYLFKRREDIAQSVYKEVFKSFDGFTNTSFIQNKWQKKFIDLSTNKKVEKKEKMLWLTKKLRKKKGRKKKGRKKNAPTVQEALSLYNKDERAQKRLLCYFQEIGFSPVPISNIDIPFMQSLGSILGFEEPSEHDKELYEILSRKMRGRKPVLYNFVE